MRTKGFKVIGRVGRAQISVGNGDAGLRHGR